MENTERSMTDGTLAIEVENFGPIIEGRVELRPLTVFVGSSNTGKSYLATLLYALHRFFSSESARNTPLFDRNRSWLRHSPSRRSLSNDDDADLKIATSMLNEIESSTNGSMMLSADIAEIFQRGLDRCGDAIVREICRCFGMDKAETLIRKGTPATSQVRIQRHMSFEEKPAEHTLSLGRNIEFCSKIPSGMQLPIPEDHSHDRALLNLLSLETDRNSRYSSIVYIKFLSWLHNLLMPHAMGPLQMPAYYLPADRTGVMHAHNVVVSALIGSAPTAGIRSATPTPLLTGVLADFLEQLIETDLYDYRHDKSSSRVASEIEDDILDGEVLVERSATISYPIFAYKPRRWQSDLSLANASSMVSELAPVVLFLRHRIEPNNVLIVEEPESHLHPGKQIQLMRKLASLVAAGVRVILITHSEYLLEELANIVLRSKLSDSDLNDIARGKPVLNPEQVGAWLFESKRRPRGSFIKEICLDSSGLFPSRFDEVAAALHNDYAEITSRTNWNHDESGE